MFSFFPIDFLGPKGCGLSKRHDGDFNTGDSYRNKEADQWKYYDKKTNAKAHDQAIVIVTDDEEAVGNYEEADSADSKAVIARKANAPYESDYIET